MNKKENHTFIKIERDRVSYGFNVFHKKDDKMFACYIPAFDMYFSCNSEEQVVTRSKNMVKSFYNFWIDNKGLKPFLLEIHKLGFRSPNHNFILKQLMNNKERKDAKFNAPLFGLPIDFQGAEFIEAEDNLAIAS